MLFNTPEFIVFLISILTIVSILKYRKFQHIFLLLGSYFFFYFTSNIFLTLLIASTILDYYVIFDSRIRPIREDQPINVAVITLDEEPEINFLSNLPGVPVEEVPVGASVEVFFEEVGPGQLIHEWRLVGQ